MHHQSLAYIPPMHHQPLAYISTPFTKVLRKAGIVTAKPTIPELIAAFDKMDLDGSGDLDHNEVKAGLAAMGASNDSVEEFMKIADTDRNGKISKNEFLIAWAKEANTVTELAQSARHY